MDRMRLLELLVAHRLGQLRHASDGVVAEQVAVVEVVEEDVEALLGVGDVGLEGWRGARFHALHVRAEDVVHGACGGGDVAAVAGRVFGGGGGALGSGLWCRPGGWCGR